MENIAYLVALQQVDGLGPVRLKILLDFYHDPKIIWKAPINELSHFKIPQSVLISLDLHRQTVDPEIEFKKITDLGISVISLSDPVYPKSLKQIYNPPILLYIVGNLPTTENSIGVVGTRMMSGYGKIVTRQLTEGLVEAGFNIISGLAKGVDTLAHQITLEKGGQTVAVLGGGLNQIFPSENINLARSIALGKGAVISEYHPDTPALPGNFPARNRIISGLSQAILVTEAAQNSGSLITARLALEEGKTIYSVPGPINSSQSAGTLELIRDGATLVTKIEDILSDFGHLGSIKPIRSVEKLTTLEYQIISKLAKEKTHLDELTRLLGQPAAKVASSMLKLEIEGFVYNEGNGVYVKNL
jgi:DNA processing protein